MEVQHATGPHFLRRRGRAPVGCKPTLEAQRGGAVGGAPLGCGLRAGGRPHRSQPLELERSHVAEAVGGASLL